MRPAENWADRALKHVRVLSNGIGARSATSVEERKAAEYVRDELQRLGISAVRLETFQGAISAWLPWSVAFSISAWGMLLGLLFDLIGGLVAAALYAVAAWIAYSELNPRVASRNPARRWLWKGDSQNVLGVVHPASTVQRQVVLMAYLDTARASFLWGNQRRRRLVRYLLPFLFLSLALSGATFLLAALTTQVLFYFLALLLLIPQVAALLVSIRADHNPASPGANNNASGVGTMLALAERLSANPLRHTEVWLLATGCRETGGDGLRAFLNTHQPTFSDGSFVALEGVGIGERVVYLTGERAIRTTPYDAEILKLAALAARRCQENGFLVTAGRRSDGPTETGMISRSGLSGLAVNAWPKEEPAVVGWRQIDDTFETIQKQALTAVHVFVWALLEEIDAER